MLKIATVCYLVCADEVLLGRKKEKIGAGCWNGAGGVVENGEKIREAAVRELREEFAVRATPRSLEAVADIVFHLAGVPTWHVYFFFVQEWNDLPREVEKMLTPTWFPADRLPLDGLMPADRVFLPMLLAGKRLRGYVFYNAEATVLEKHHFTEVARLET